MTDAPTNGGKLAELEALVLDSQSRCDVLNTYLVAAEDRADLLSADLSVCRSALKFYAEASSEQLSRDGGLVARSALLELLEAEIVANDPRALIAAGIERQLSRLERETGRKREEIFRIACSVLARAREGRL